MENIIKKAGVLVEAIPYIHEFRKKIFVLKYGGSILDDDAIRKRVLEDIVFLSFVGIRIILVHGGGPHISSRLKEQDIESEFHDGVRVTNKEALDVVQQELNRLSEKITQEIQELKGDVFNLKGPDDLIVAEKKKSDKDLGFVGSVKQVHTDLLKKHLPVGYVVVVQPMGRDEQGQLYNINADEVANALAATMGAEKLVLLTNVQGVMRDPNDAETLYSSLTLDEIQELIQKEVIHGGMIPKVISGIQALKCGVQKAHIIDARIQHALLLEIFTDKGVGTQLIAGN